MVKNIFNKIFPKKKGSKRGVSPVIATILLIALTVSAAAIVYFVVVPLLQGQGELVLMSSVTLTDEDDDGNFDTVEANLFNLGTDTVILDDSLTMIIHSGVTTNYLWTITTDKEFIVQEEQIVKAESTSAEEQITPYSQYEVKITYGGKEISLGRLFSSMPTNSTGSGEEEPTVTYLSSALVYRTSANDPSTCRGTFPTTAGYSPRLYFLVGIFDSGTSSLDSSTFDYINANGFGAAEDYHPYIGTTDTFTERITSHTGNTVLAYNDSGLYPGCVTFRGTSFDPNDDLDWPQKGIVYMYTYIYNPTDDAMDLDLSVQVDDGYELWLNGEFLSSGKSNQWNRWRASQTITLDPGYNVFTFKAADNQGNWDAQILLWDAGEADSITSLLNVWPLLEPTSTNW